MRLILFDIDGTLLLTGGIGQTSARAALETVFATSGRLDQFYPGGRTIEAIFRDTLQDSGISVSEYREKRDDLYAEFFEEFKRRLDSGVFDIRALPGVNQLLLELSDQPEFILGLVTGNHRYTARYKLSAAGIDLDYFTVGAYGDESFHRPDLIKLAKSRAAEGAGQPFNGSSTIMIGDTTRDVLSAREAGAFSIAVASGTDDWEQLHSVSPDVLVESLADVDMIMSSIFAQSTSSK